MPTWPSGLPLPRADGFKSVPLRNFVEFQSDKPNVSKRRAVNTRRSYTVNFTMTCTAAQSEAVDDFYFSDCGGGALSFSWTHPLLGAGTAQFTEEPSASPRPRTGRLQVSVALKFWI